MILPNSMFDDDSIECKNFTVSDNDGYYICEWDWIKKKFNRDTQRAIFQAMHLKQYYIVVYNEGPVVEISWD